MRLIVFFDLPVGTAAQRKSYRLFKRYLEKNGFLMMQESVYTKLAVNDNVCAGVLTRLRQNRPPEGLVQVLKVTERQFASIECIVGEGVDHGVIDDIEGLVIL